MHISIDNNGISLVDAPPGRLRADPDANQSHPRESYVYAHLDQDGNIFYIGKGAGRRAWSDDRHPLWHRYVERRTGGKYEVKVLIEGLSADEAERLESQWLAQEVATLVNWINMARRSDYGAIDQFRRLRNANRALAQLARELEKDAPAQAAEKYAAAIAAIAEYAFIKFELDLVGDLIDDENAEFGFSGDLAILERYTMVLVKLGRAPEAKAAIKDYIAKYKRDQSRSSFEKMYARVEKALRKA
ncbi:hypothetical protein HHL21_20775 [Massilia sp. RP-1-19]|uniref:GIY-YIG domain-containing protein n=1 Tax=Massilia polaris TaxID=2728846 RepID=A0A848HNG7_9BURK|nr:hypothetical protein [Massilia polaris]NML63476.1 hypothetical protein [Massilia polaris]